MPYLQQQQARSAKHQPAGNRICHAAQPKWEIPSKGISHSNAARSHPLLFKLS